MTPEVARNERPRTRIGRPFQKGNPGKPRGVKNKNVLAGILAAKALEARAWDVLESLLAARSGRVKLEAAKTILGYACGLPRQTLELTGGFGDLAGELARALQAVRERRLALPAVVSGERPVNENGEIPPPIEALHHTVGMREAIPALPPAVLEAEPAYLGEVGRTSAAHPPAVSPGPAGAAIVAGIAEAAPVHDVATLAPVANGAAAPGDPDEEDA